MTKHKEILRLHHQSLSSRSIASLLGCSRNTVAKVLDALNRTDLAWSQLELLTEDQLTKLLFPPVELDSNRLLPDFEQIHKELAKPGVNLTLLWDEYCLTARMAGKIPYMYTQFNKMYRDFAVRNKATMHLHRKPGDSLEVDWAGQKAHILDSTTGEVLDAFVFVSTLSSSQYTYAEGFLDMSTESWISAHIHAFQFYGGVPRSLINDNLKTGVVTPHFVDPLLNRTYQELAEHYGTVILPARVKRPKDKPSVESSVSNVSTWIIAALRHQQFFSLADLNQGIREKLKELNRKPFQKKPTSREQAFRDEERDLLLPLPVHPFEIAQWKTATVQFNYHITVEKMNYSVPYEYIKEKVDVRMTPKMVEIFLHQTRIASHLRLHGKPGQYSTTPEHMPEKHQSYMLWDGARFLHWAKQVGPHTEIVVQSILNHHKIEQQGYKSCFGLLKLADRYSPKRLEAACQRALSYTPQPNYRSIQTILKNGSDKLKVDIPEKTSSSTQYGYIRGADYYGKGDKK